MKVPLSSSSEIQDTDFGDFPNLIESSDPMIVDKNNNIKLQDEYMCK